MSLNRRQFVSALGRSSAVLSIGAACPGFLRTMAACDDGNRRESILVVLQLSGGNDGLNTVIPFRDETYYQARPTLAVPRERVLKVSDEAGLHPAAAGLSDLWEQGQVAIVQGIGYDQPNRSHFESMDIWHTCLRKDQPRSTGWLGRGLDDQRRQGNTQVNGIHVGHGKQPMALAARDVASPSIDSPEQFRLQEDDSKVLQTTIESVAKPEGDGEPGLLGFLQQSTSSALQASDRVAKAMQCKGTSVTYPNHQLGRKFETVARLIGGGLDTRIYYLELDGFDTHSQQGPAHETLLEQWGSALSAFQLDLKELGRDNDVAVMCFSEFGRRVAENASAGTDHGAAAPCWVVGSGVAGGLVGAQPSLTELDDGDLKYHTDFRRVYATLLDQWLGWDSGQVLGKGYEPLKLFSNES